MRPRRGDGIWEIYLITCQANGKQYIGQTGSTAYARWGWTISQAKAGKKSFPLHEAIREHGPHAFTIEVIAVCKSKADANWLESQLIKQHGTRAPNGYNMTDGIGALGIKLTESQLTARGARIKAMWANPEYRAKATEAARKSGPARGTKMRVAMKAIWAADPERKARARKLLDAAREKRHTGPGARSYRMIRDNRQSDLLG
jgi:hypothetical protein